MGNLPKFLVSSAAVKMIGCKEKLSGVVKYVKFTIGRTKAIAIATKIE